MTRTRPGDALAPFDIVDRSIDAFLTHLFWLRPSVMTRIVQEQAADLEEPPVTVDELLDELVHWAPTFVDLVRRRL